MQSDRKTLFSCNAIEIAKFSQKLKNKPKDTPQHVVELINSTKNHKLRTKFKINKNLGKKPPKDQKFANYQGYAKFMWKKTAEGKNVNAFVLMGGKNEYAKHFSFTNPIIELSSDGNIIRNYEKFQEGDTLFIWQCLDQTKQPFHLSAVVKTRDNEYYSFGFGLISSTLQTNIRVGIDVIDTQILNSIGTATGVLYTPDGMFEGKLLYQTKYKTRKYVNLISSVDLTAEHVANMKSAFDYLNLNDIESSDMKFYPVPQEDGSNMQNMLDELNNELLESKGLADDEAVKESVRAFISEAKQDKNVPCKYVYSASYSIKHQYEYCRFSTGKKKTQNCASFLNKIFAGSIDCGILANLVSVDPKRCTRGHLPIKTCRRTPNPKSRSSSRSSKYKTPPSGPK